MARYEWSVVVSALEVSLNDMRYINSRFTYLLTYFTQQAVDAYSQHFRPWHVVSETETNDRPQIASPLIVSTTIVSYVGGIIINRVTYSFYPDANTSLL